MSLIFVVRWCVGIVICFLTDWLSGWINHCVSGSTAMQGLPQPTCLLKVPWWLYTMKHRHKYTRSSRLAHCSHEICDLVHQTQRHVHAGVCMCLCVCLYVCVCACIWQTGSPSAQAPTIGSLSRHIKVCFSVCLLAIFRCYFSLSLFVSLSVCLCTNLSDFMTPATVIKKQYRCLKGDNSKRGLKRVFQGCLQLLNLITSRINRSDV